MNSQLSMLIQSDMLSIRNEASTLGRDEVSAAIGEPSAGFSFSDRLKQAIESVDAKEMAANDKMLAVDSGQSDDLVGAMLASQDASLSFSMLMQVRNKVAGAIDELIKLQV